jgi:predicted amidohydrolase
MRVAAIQFKAPTDERSVTATAAATRTLSTLCDQAGQQGAQLIVCPEMAATRYLFTDATAAARIAEPATGPGYQELAAVAQRHAAYLVCGYAEQAFDADGKPSHLYNSARVIGPDGALLYNYRKRLLFDADETWASPGDVPYPLLQTPHARLAAGICMDLNDDRFTAFLRQTAPHVVAFCTNWVDEGFDVRPYWRYRLQDVPSYFIAANTYGEESARGHARTTFSGCSAILSPQGRTLALAPKLGDAVLVADLPLP